MDIRIISLSIFGLVLALAGCETSRPEPLLSEKGWVNISDSENFKIEIPPQIKEKIHRDDDSWAFTTFDTSSIHRNKDDYSVQLYSKKVTSCSKSILGISEIREGSDKESKTVWGKVDEQQAAPDPPFPDALCYIPQENCSKEEYWSGGCHTGAAAYGFCAEKNGKRVVVCISQITDNPQLAEEIFKTFKWTK